MVDSDNSGSNQSSSTGGGGGGGEEEEEEYMNISRSESIPTFLNPTTSQFDSSESNPNPDHHHQSSVLLSNNYQNHQPPFYDLLSSSNYGLQLEAFSQYSNETNPNPNPNPNFLLNHDPVHHESRGGELRNYSTPETQSVYASQLLKGMTSNTSSNIKPSSSTKVARNSKKRSRASRRPPTTILTTDTTNFRAMVQEFTGIPEPPFSTSTSSSSFSRSNRFDPFGYPLRPSPLKINQPSSLPFLNNNFQISTDHQGFPTTHNHLVNMQNPGLSFQSYPHDQYPSDLNQGSNLALTSLEEMNIMSNHIGYVSTNPDTLLHINEDQGCS